jgi:hypothetical protein
MTYRIIERQSYNGARYVVQTTLPAMGQWQHQLVPYHGPGPIQNPWRDISSFDDIESARKYLKRTKNFLNENERVIE